VNRFVVSSQNIHGATLRIDDPREVRHLRQALRLKRGDPLECFDERGITYRGVISFVAADQVVVGIEERVAAPVPAFHVWLAQSVLKTDRFEWVVQKATELGVERIVPLVTQRTVVRVARDGGGAKQARWQRIAQEAAKQCQRASVPVVEAPQPFASCVSSITPGLSVLIPTLAMPTRPLRTVLESTATPPQGWLVFIGPEGDFTPAEVRLAHERGAIPVSLGTRTLRSETAAVAVLAILNYVGGG